MKPILFIDGHAGTTGLRIRHWLSERDDIKLLTLSDSDRKSTSARKKAIADANLALLCLPDDAASEASEWAINYGTKVLDASTCHRVTDGWTYGLPELSPKQRASIQAADRVSNPGCYPSSVILMLKPLVDGGLLSLDTAISVYALTGYSGGGKSLIEKWEAHNHGLRDLTYEAPYALERIHKHIPEMQRYSGLSKPPQFLPAVGPFHSGMRVQVPIHESLLCDGVSGKEVWSLLSERYFEERFVEVAPFVEFKPIDEKHLDPTVLNGTNRLRIHVFPNPAGHLLLIGLLDNLGKGASGVAIQCLNLMMGLPEAKGLPA